MSKLTARDFAKVQYVMVMDTVTTIKGIEPNRPDAVYIDYIIKGKTHGVPVAIESCLPILRPMSDMTEEETATFKNKASWAYGAYVHTPASVDYLDSIQVDCRGWIEKGVAIDATTLGDKNPFKIGGLND